MIDTNTYLGKFEIIECLKKDRFAAVYLANHILLGKKIILKTLESSSDENKVLLERFTREAKILARLEHPNIIRVLDFGFSGNIFYLSFEYFKSSTLREMLQQRIWTIDNKKWLLAQLLKAIDYAHHQNIIHRDLKPENILVNEALELKIADFGLALSSNNINVTNAYSVVGTPGYMSPEQISGDKLTQKSDLFSAGIVAYELFTGINPFVGHDISSTLNNILRYNDNKLSELIQSLDEESKSVISLLLRKNSDKRTDNISEILEKLGYKNYTNNDISTSTADIHIDKPGKRINTSYILISLLIIITFGLLYYFNSYNSRNEIKNKSGGQKKDLLTNSSTNPIKVKSPDNINKTSTREPIVKTATAEKKDIPAENINATGQLFIECSPWAKIYVDSEERETTPLKDYIQLPVGEHTITLKHPEFPDYTFQTKIEKNKKNFEKLNLKLLFGYLDLKIYPWGEVYINDVYKGTTPISAALVLKPGEYKVTIKNPGHPDFEKKVLIAMSKTFEFRYNFFESKDSTN